MRILSNDFEALHVVAAGAEECASPTVTVTKNQTTEHKDIQVAALTTDPATYTVAMVANNSIVPLLNAGLVRPLDDLVEQYGQNLQDSQLIRIDGQVMAIAFMANAQHLHYRARPAGGGRAGAARVLRGHAGQRRGAARAGHPGEPAGGRTTSPASTSARSS